MEKILSQLLYYKNKGVPASIPIAMVFPWETELDVQGSICFVFGSCNTTPQAASYKPTPIFQKWPRTCSQFCKRSPTACEHVIGRCLHSCLQKSDWIKNPIQIIEEGRVGLSYTHLQCLLFLDASFFPGFPDSLGKLPQNSVIQLN